ncbi:hemagglutinin repeat-containing protein [Edwardsiella anguillarum]|nr:hemagglutinin repeat-containing protein [Edwardsiella anguillarum]
MLDAGRDILLTASQDTNGHESQSRGRQFSAGVGVSLMGAQNGISVELGASQQKGREHSQSLGNTNSVIRADGQLTVNSGRDSVLKGAELKGNRVVVSSGRDLILSSVQDTASYDSKLSSSGAGLSLCIPRCAMACLPVTSAHQGKTSPRMAGVCPARPAFLPLRAALTSPWVTIPSWTGRLSPLAPLAAITGWRPAHSAGRISVTQAKRAVIVIPWRYRAVRAGENRNVAPAVGSGQAAERGSGITSAAISHGSIIIGDKDNQIQDIAGLSRDTANAHQGVGVSGAVQKVRDSLAAQSEGMALGLPRWMCTASMRSRRQGSLIPRWQPD